MYGVPVSAYQELGSHRVSAEPTSVWQLAAGFAAALVCLMAPLIAAGSVFGVSLSFKGSTVVTSVATGSRVWLCLRHLCSCSIMLYGPSDRRH